MIRPQVPLRTPCYNLARLAELRIVASWRKHLIQALLNWLDGRCVQSSGTYSPQYNELQLLGIPGIHEGELQPSIRTEAKVKRLTSPFGVVTRCLSHCMPRVAQGIRAIQIYRGPLLPQHCCCSPHRVPQKNFLSCNYGCGSRPLPELTGRFIVRADDDHTTPLSVSGKPFGLSIILLSALVRLSGVVSN